MLSHIVTASRMKIAVAISSHNIFSLVYKHVTNFVLRMKISITRLQHMSDVFVLCIYSVWNCAILSIRKEIMIKNKHGAPGGIKLSARKSSSIILITYF